MSTNNVVWFTNLLNRSEQLYLNNLFYDNIQHAQQFKNAKATHDDTFNWAVGRDYDIILDKIINNLNTIVGITYGIGYNFSHCFFRDYNTDTIFLNPHVDRETLDITFSVCITDTIKQEWPIFISDTPLPVVMGPNWLEDSTPYYRNAKKYIIKPGEGICFKGREKVHWRDELKLQPDENMLQVFFHWTKI